MSHEKPLEERLKRVEDSLTKLHEKIDMKVNNVKFIQEEKDEIVVGHTVDVKYTKEVHETDVMVMDTGCPKSLVGRDWLMKYMEKNGLDKKNLQRKQCDQKFRFGPSKIYKSNEIVSLPISVKEKEKENEFVRVFMDVFVVDADNVPLLCGKNTMKLWKIIIDMVKETVVIDINKTR